MSKEIGNLIKSIESLSEQEAVAIAMLCRGGFLYEAVLKDASFKEAPLKLNLPTMPANGKGIRDFLIEIGVPANLYGFTYLHKAIAKVSEDPELIHNVTKSLYPEIAKECNTTWSRVDRAIRHAIDSVYARGNIELMNKLTPAARNGRSTGSEFIAVAAEYLRGSR